ncbi:MAG: hypothetical protein JW800_00640 [Candidatus Omnitrophica bacterium]|nr:hypothetical protein [Candidatus Omnitrophota bacterium]
MPMSNVTITLTAALDRRLTDFCKREKIMKGEKYYRVPDYNSAISVLLDGYLKKRKSGR